MITQENKSTKKMVKNIVFTQKKENKKIINLDKQKELLESIEDAKKSKMTFDDVNALFSYLKS